MEVMTFNIDKDRRNLVDDKQNYNIDFHDSKYNWLQARQYEESMRQVEVHVVHGDGSPVDLTGVNPVFEGWLPEGLYRIIDAKHSVMVDAQNGIFRFDFPAPAFQIAGSYKQAFFRLMKDGKSVTTLEFSLDVMADKVISGLVPSDYITPFEDLYNNLKDYVTKSNGDFDTAMTQWKKDVADLITELNADVSGINLTITEIKTQLSALEDKIKADGLFTKADFDKFMSDINDQLALMASKDELGKLKERVDNSYLEALTLSMTYNPNDTTRYTKILGLYSGLNTPITLVNMISIDSKTGSVLTPASEEDLQKAITDATGKGYRITMIKPHLGPNYNDGFKKYNYMPDDVDLFFKNYKKVLLSQAKLANDNGIPILCLAAELNLLVGPKYLGQWTDIINDIRDAYPNLKLTIAAASPFKTDDQALFPYLDYIGINWYPYYVNKLIKKSSDIPTEAQLSQAMMTNHSNDILNEMATTDIELFMEMARKYDKPIWITETGVMPKPDGLAQLISNSGASDIYDVPAAAMNAFVHTIGQMGPVVGINWWHAQSPFNLAPENGDGSTTVAMQAWANLLKEVNND
ncbi:BppU family phage baseplate upper protein [Pediococcus acidilactici]|jgi:hypothetical protein|uniref:BppU family phage baseplate upper protein n=1 Tax=Pediococcus acidilactici TaxID=1254 RepID=UPI001320A93A|nr:BppU family phage baseplate upper protein [Pediococcus acidilactici]KAF0373154.1 DUF2479 domain-containing protein [Pediococcus acidilactici]KAF0383654.1 DUF2479 domain-containing protein [Pediococcus acidilactici]KAF0457640.1 DUF2479 domain-containing protein [Pediococcus acidilactici]KAF0476926.1 DUF2479 domain-containing protein [Pediococcus acidilactici]KAF0537452.1 DUF2479 domain-containing protein [Pediococcus acidilactici]